MKPYFILLFFNSIFARAGEGLGGSGGTASNGLGSGHGNRHGGNFYYGDMESLNNFLIAIIIISIVLFITLIIWIKKKLVKAKRIAHDNIISAANLDDIWNKVKIEEFVKNSFITIQKAWSNNDRNTLKSLLTNSIYSEWKEKMDLNQSHSISNIIEDITLKSIEFVHACDYKSDNNDFFTVQITASLVDKVIDNKSDKTIDKSGVVTEFWKYRRFKNSWLLDEITQSGIFNEWKILDDNKK